MLLNGEVRLPNCRIQIAQARTAGLCHDSVLFLELMHAIGLAIKLHPDHAKPAQGQRREGDQDPQARWASGRLLSRVDLFWHLFALPLLDGRSD